MTKKVFDLLVIGEICVDLILRGGDLRPRFGQAEQLVEQANLVLGGSTALLACGAARLGLKVTFASKVGQDEFGNFALGQLARRGVDTSHVVRTPSEKTGLTVHLSLPDDRSMLTYPGTMGTFSGEDIPEDLLNQARHVHLSSYFLQPGIQPNLASIFSTAHRYGATTSLDTGWDPSEGWDSGLARVLSEVDIFLPNENEAMAITRAESVHQAAVKLAEIIPSVVIKQGDKGVLARQAGKEYFVPAFNITPIETTGAGDNFNAGFLFARLDGLPLEACLHWGAACGALATLQPGGLDGQLPASEVQAWMAAHGWTG
jgi:sugar/nucleoside kinase (ribokinase family)